MRTLFHEDLCKEGDTVWLSYHLPQKKTAPTGEFTEVENGYVGINTAAALPNKLVYENIESGSIKELRG